MTVRSGLADADGGSGQSGLTLPHTVAGPSLERTLGFASRLREAGPDTSRDLPQGDVHGGVPVHPIVRPFVKRRHRLAIVAQNPGGAGVVAAPRPGSILECQILVGDVALGVEEVGSEAHSFRVVADELDPADAGI